MDKLKIGFMPIILGAYIEMIEGLGDRAQKRIIEPVIKRLEGFGDVIYPGIISSMEKGREARSAFLANDADVIIVQNLSYSTSEVPFSVFRGMRIPLIVINSQLRRTISEGFKLENIAEEHCLVGSTELASLLKRIGYPKYYIVSGLLERDSTFDKLTPILKAVQVKKLLENSNIGYIGSTVYTGMMDIEADETLLKSKLGLNIIHLKNTEIAQTMNSVTRKEIDAKKVELAKKYNVADIKDEDLEPSLKTVIALRSLLLQYMVPVFHMWSPHPSILILYNSEDSLSFLTGLRSPLLRRSRARVLNSP